MCALGVDTAEDGGALFSWEVVGQRDGVLGEGEGVAGVRYMVRNSDVWMVFIVGL